MANKIPSAIFIGLAFPCFLVSCTFIPHEQISISKLQKQQEEAEVVQISDAPSLKVSDHPYDCGPESADLILRYWNQAADYDSLMKSLYNPEKEGTRSTALLPLFRQKNLNARLMKGSWDLLKTAIEAEIPPITMVEQGVAPSESSSLTQKLYQGQFHFYPVTGFVRNPRHVLVEAGEQTQAIPWNTFQSMWKQTDNYFLLAWDPDHHPNPEGSKELRTRHNRAIELMNEGKSTRARKIHRRNLEENPLFAHSFGALGELYLKNEEFEKAETYLRKALRRDPALFQHQNNLAWLLIRQDKSLQEAQKRIQMVIRFATSRDTRKKLLAHAYHTRGFYHFQNEQFQRALGDLGTSYSLTTDTMKSLRADILYRMGQVQSALERPIEARFSLKRAEKMVRGRNQDLRKKIHRALKSMIPKQ